MSTTRTKALRSAAEEAIAFVESIRALQAALEKMERRAVTLYTKIEAIATEAEIREEKA